MDLSSQEETQNAFVAQEDDELWDVERITAERQSSRGKEYRVVWKGVDPKTGKPWPQSWVPRRDCTDDLVEEWKRVKKARSKASTSRASTSRVKAERHSSAVPPSISAARSPSLQPTGTKRKRQSAHSSAKHSDVVPPGGTEVVYAREEEEEEEEEAPVAPPKAIQPHKKRKVKVEIDTPPPKTRLKRAQPIEPQPASSPIEPFSQSFEEVERGLQISEPETDDQDRVARRPKKPLSTTTATTTTASLSPPPAQLPPNIKIGPPRSTKSGSRISIVGGNTAKKTNGIKKTKSKASVVEPPPPPLKKQSKNVEPEVEHDDALPPEPPLDAYATTDPGLDDEGPPPPVSPTSPPRTDSVPTMEWSKTKASLSEPPVRKPLVGVEPLDLSQSQEKIHLAPPTRPVGKSPSLQEAARSAFRAVVEKPMEVLSIFWEGKSRGASGSAPEVPVQRVEVVEDDPESRLSPAAIRRLKKWEKDLGVIEEWERKKREKENARRGRGKEGNGKGKEKEKEKEKEQEKEKEVEVVNTSYSGEIVPETQSQIPRDKSPTPPHTLALATIPPPNNVLAPVPVPQTPNSLHRQDSLRARMKPRTPRSASRPLSRAETAPSALFAPHAPKFNLMTNALPPLPDDDGDHEDDEEPVEKCVASTSTSIEVVAPTSLRPVPLVSSNDFSPYLNLDAPSGVVDEVEAVVSTLESAKDSIVDPDGAFPEAAVGAPNGKDKGKADAHDPSIEEFESPKKSRVGRTTTAIVQVKVKQTKPCGPIPGTTALTEDTDFVAKGMEIAERVKRQQQAAETEKRGRKRLPLQDRRDVLDRVVANRARSRSEEVAGLSGDDLDGDVLSRRHSSPEWDMGDMGKVYEGGEDVEARDDRPPEGLGHMTMDDLTKAFEGGEDLGALDEDNDADNDDARAPQPTSPPAPRPAPAAESLTVTDADMTYPSMTMDDIVAAYNQPDAIDPLMLREEEEETTQDVATEAQPQHLQPLPTVVEEPEATEDAMDVEVKAPSTSGSDDGRSAVPEIVIEGASRAPSVTTSPTTTDGARPPPSRRTRSTRSRSNTPAPAPAPAPPPARRLRSQSREPDPVPSKVHKGKGRSDPSEHLSSLLTAKSEEIARLDAQLESLRADFQTQLSTLSTRLSEAQSSKSHLSEQLEQAKLELQKRTAELEAAKKAKTSAENDKEFMREQYLRSSAYVSDIRDENKALELRASVAEGQVSTGLAMVKATFEQRIKVLEADVKSWRRMAEFLMEKDRRTDDDVRKRAAEEPELRRKVKRVKLELEAARNEIDMLGDSLEEKEEQLQGAVADVGRERREKAELLVALEEAEDKLRRLGMSGAASQESMGSEGHEFVYRCKWRVEDGQSCSETFSTIRALQQHLYEGHLPP